MASRLSLEGLKSYPPCQQTDQVDKPGGIMINLPRSLHEAYKLHLAKPNHPSVKMFGSSLQAHRSCHEAIIFLYGVSGSGKSSTINHLFDADLVPTSEWNSCTDSVTEFVCSFASEHWEVSNLEVGFIDVPGWGDSQGRDATNFTLIQHFLSMHPILGSKIRKFYPNIVLLVFNSNDNRMHGKASNAERMLQALSELDIIDQKNPNVVIVLTHVCSCPIAEFKTNLQKLSKVYQNLFRTYLSVNPPVVWLENNSSGHQLKTVGDWTLLYDGTAQPLNLYEAMKSLMINANDELGREAIRLCFQGRNKISISPIKRLVVNSQSIDSELRQKMEEQWSDFLSKNSIKFKSSELSTLLLDYVASHEELGLDKNDIEGLLLALTNSPSFPDVNSIKGAPLTFVREQLMPYPLTREERLLLINALKLSVSDSPYCLNDLGRGYNVITEEIGSTDIFEFSDSKDLNDFLNCFVTKSKTIFPLETQRITFGALDLKMPSTVFRLRRVSLLNLNVKSTETEHIQLFRENVKELKEPEFIQSLFWIESGVFMVQLNFPHVRLSNPFYEAVNALPTKSLDDKRRVNGEYESFFEEFGHFAIIKASGGGLIEGRLKIENIKLNAAANISLVQSMLSMYIDFIKEGENWGDFRQEFSTEEQRILEELDSAPLEWLSGELLNVPKTFDQVSKQTYKNWQDSLKRSSTLFEHTFSLIPIYLLAEGVNINTASQLKIAFQSLLPETKVELYYDDNPTQIHNMGSEFGSSAGNSNPGKPVSKVISRQRRAVKSTSNLDSPPVKTIPQDKLLRSTITEHDISHDINSPKCFPGISNVMSKNRGYIKMKDLEIRDHILSLDMRTHKPVYSKVYMWGHLDPDLTATFIEIHYEGGVLRLTENHLLLSGHDMSFTTAARVRRGDVVYCVKMTDTQSLRGIEVKSVNRVKLTGVYAPFTHNSLIVVDGLVCSAFAIPDLSITKFDRFEKLSRICMSPMRLMDSMGISRIHRNPLNDFTKIDWYAQLLLRLYELFSANKVFHNL